MQLKSKRFFLTAFVLVFISILLPFAVYAEGGDESTQALLISKIKTGPGSDEYIEIFNPDIEAVDTTGGNWRIEYLSSSHDGGLNPTRNMFIFSDEVIGPQSFYVIKHSSFNAEGADNDFAVNAGGGSLAKSGGSIRIMKGDKLIDLVGWGSATQKEVKASFSDELAPLSRCFLTSAGPMMDTDNNSSDFSEYETAVLRHVPLCPAPTEPDPDDGGMGGGSGGNCAGIIVTEILPNPSGSDNGHEFIELYNPTSKNISLKGCLLQTTASSKMYTISDIALAPGQYKAFYNDLTGLTLNNSSDSSVYLVYSDNSEQEVSYPGGMEDEVAWAYDLASNIWSITYVSTPSAKNKIVKIKPCPAGQFRNAQTNRCNKIAIEAGLAPCPAGKFRNPETNRCKSILSADSQLKSCNAGQFRNPETNRCKSFNSSNSLVPCKSGQERNPETNRCRKIAGSESSNRTTVKDVLSAADTENKTSWAIAGFSFAGASAYAVWEWRREMLDGILSLKNKFNLK